MFLFFLCLVWNLFPFYFEMGRLPFLAFFYIFVYVIGS